MATKTKPKRLVDTFTATTGGFGADLLPAGYGYNKKYRYKINLEQYGVGYDIIGWCLKNCKSKWGWYFVPTKREDGYLEDYENQDAILTFKSKQDAVYFKLTHA
jgi:hypothetical protein